MTFLEYLIVIPILTGIILFAIPERAKWIKGIIAFLVSALALYVAGILYLKGTFGGEMYLLGSVLEEIPGMKNLLGEGHIDSFIYIDSLSKLITLFVSFFTVLIILYSWVYARKEKQYYKYYSYILLTLGAANGAVLADHLLLFISFWGFLGLTLYKLIKGADDESAEAAKKTLILIGGSDALMIFGIGIIWKITGTFNISELNISTNYTLAVLAFLSLLVGSFTKAGAFPFHSWIPEFSRKAPASSSAYLPAALDKLLGIYFLARICNQMFILNQWLTFMLILLGVLTIIIGVMMALVQHNYKKLLGYHAVSQVGYMVTGLALGTTLGIIGGLFHMINNALYKSGLFLVAGSVEEQTGKDELDDLGGLSGRLPVTFITALIFALAISGVPPFNGFASKWIIYQGIIDFGREAGLANSLWIVWLALAVIGSALTLASFIKFITGIFLGRKRKELSNVKESSVFMLVPMGILALLCIGFGVFATHYVVPYFFAPIVGTVEYVGIWDPGVLSLLVLLSIVLGVIVYLIFSLKTFRREDSFIGGESIQESTGFAITGFYHTLSHFRLLSFFYKKAGQKVFDIYEVSKNGVYGLYKSLCKAHNGILLTYSFWMVMGLIILLIVINVI